MRLFKCIGLTESKIDYWKDCFTIGKNYLLHCKKYGTGLILIDNSGYCMAVDEDQFKEITFKPEKTEVKYPEFGDYCLGLIEYGQLTKFN